MRSVWVVLLGLLLGGCGAGGGGGGSVSSGEVALDLVVQAPSVQTVIYGVQFTVRLPAGVTVTADSAGKVADEVLQVKDPGARALAAYTPATATAPAAVVVNIADATGFPPGDLASVVCRDPSGGSGSYVVEGFSARDGSGAPLDGVSLRFSLRPL